MLEQWALQKPLLLVLLSVCPVPGAMFTAMLSNATAEDDRNVIMKGTVSVEAAARPFADHSRPLTSSER